MKRVAESRIRAHWLWYRLDGSFYHLLEVGHWNPTTEPGGLHFRQRYRPKFAVVRQREVLCDTAAPNLEDELFKISRLMWTGWKGRGPTGGQRALRNAVTA